MPAHLGGFGCLPMVVTLPGDRRIGTDISLPYRQFSSHLPSSLSLSGHSIRQMTPSPGVFAFARTAPHFHGRRQGTLHYIWGGSWEGTHYSLSSLEAEAVVRGGWWWQAGCGQAEEALSNSLSLLGRADWRRQEASAGWLLHMPFPKGQGGSMHSHQLLWASLLSLSMPVPHCGFILKPPKERKGKHLFTFLHLFFGGEEGTY